MSDHNTKLPYYSARYSIIIVNKESDKEVVFGTFTTHGDTYYELVLHINWMISDIKNQFSPDNIVMFKWENGDFNQRTEDTLG